MVVILDLLPLLLPPLLLVPSRGADAPQHGHGGWGNLSAPSAVSVAACSCRRVRLADLRSVPDEPVIVEGVTEGWPAVDRWQRPHLLTRHGHVEISVATTAEVTAFGGTSSSSSCSLSLARALYLSLVHSCCTEQVGLALGVLLDVGD